MDLDNIPLDRHAAVVNKIATTARRQTVSVNLPSDLVWNSSDDGSLQKPVWLPFLSSGLHATVIAYCVCGAR